MGVVGAAGDVGGELLADEGGDGYGPSAGGGLRRSDMQPSGDLDDLFDHLDLVAVEVHPADPQTRQFADAQSAVRGEVDEAAVAQVDGIDGGNPGL